MKTKCCDCQLVINGKVLGYRNCNAFRVKMGLGHMTPLPVTKDEYDWGSRCFHKSGTILVADEREAI